jgi:threonine dehydratase
MVDIEAIRSAATLLQGRVRRTELISSHDFSERIGTPIWFKCENLQRTGSFKIRGASNYMLCQPIEALAAGVITASAGNHAQGIACAAEQIGIRATVVMPKTTPLAKVMATKSYGAEVVLHGTGFDDAVVLARQLEKERGLRYVPAFDDPLIIAGQGTVGLEIIQQLPEIDTLLVPIGGGGLIAGVALAARATGRKLRIIGVQAAGCPSALVARREGAPVALPSAKSLADGITVKRLGDQTFPLIEALVDDLVTVEEEEIAQAIVSLLEMGKLVVEGAGAVTLAALLYSHQNLAKGNTVCVLSGGNLDVQTMSRVIERGMLGEGRFLKVRIDLPDIPGALAELAGLLAAIEANILHVSHDRHTLDVTLGHSKVQLELETRGPEHIQLVIEKLKEAGCGAEIEY